MKKVLLIVLFLAVIVRLLYASPPKEGTERRDSTSEDMLPQPDYLPSALHPQTTLSADKHPSGNHHIQSEIHHTASKQNHGIDVSHYQGIIDWTKVAQSGEVSFVYIKVTEGEELVDMNYRQNLRGARRAKLPVGAYHFYRPNANVQLQFINFCQNVFLREMDLIPIIDVEIRGRESQFKFRFKLKQFLEMVEHHFGVRPMIYTSRDFYNKHLAGHFTDYKYMIARYHPDIPELRDNASFVLWQYSSSSTVPGILHHVDRSCFVDDYTLDDILLSPAPGHNHQP